MGLTSNQYFLFEESIKTTNGDKLFRRPKFRLGPKDRRNFDPGKRPPEFRPGAKDRRNFDPGKRPPEFRPGPKDRRNFDPGQKTAGISARVEIPAVFWPEPKLI
jgi:hypothetical protein